MVITLSKRCPFVPWQWNFTTLPPGIPLSIASTSDASRHNSTSIMPVLYLATHPTTILNVIVTWSMDGAEHRNKRRVYHFGYFFAMRCKKMLPSCINPFDPWIFFFAKKVTRVTHACLACVRQPCEGMPAPEQGEGKMVAIRQNKFSFTSQK